MLLQTHNLSIQIGKKAILENVNVRVEANEIVTIIGPNGSGKSTFLRSLIGALTPSHGQIIRSPGLSIGYVPQRLHIDETLPMTVKRFLQLPRPSPLAEIRQQMTNAGVPDLLNQQLMSLSGGQLQRVLLARALLEKPNLLLLDEPTQGLDRRGTAAFYRQIDEIRQEFGCAVIMVSHDLQIVMRRAERVICLNGTICCQGKPQTVSASAEFQALFGIEEEEDALALYRHKSHHHDSAPIRGVV